MLTKADKTFLKENFATKDDLKDLRAQLNDDIEGKLTRQKEQIVKDVAEFVADTIVPMFEKRDKQMARIEKKISISPQID